MISEDELKKGSLTLSEISTSSITVVVVVVVAVVSNKKMNLVYDSLNFHVHCGLGHRLPDT